jgi:hypothetical protein
MAKRVTPYLIALLIGVIGGFVASPGVVAILALVAFAGYWAYVDRRDSR